MYAPPTNIIGWTRLLLSTLRSHPADVETINRLYRENDQLKRHIAHLELNIRQGNEHLDHITIQLLNGNDVLRHLRTYLPQLRTSDADLSDIFHTIHEHVGQLQKLLRSEG